MRQAPVVTVIEDLHAPPDGTADAYLRLHLLSHRLVKPHDVNLDGIFGALPNVAWTSVGPVDPANLTARPAAEPARTAPPLQVFSARQVPAHDRLRRAHRACAWPTPTACASARTSPTARR